MKQAIWMTNKFTNYSSVFIESDNSTDDRPKFETIKLLGNTMSQQLFNLANIIASYKLTTLKVDKEYLIFEAPLNQLLMQSCNYNTAVKLEELTE